MHYNAIIIKVLSRNKIIIYMKTRIIIVFEDVKNILEINIIIRCFYIYNSYTHKIY